MPPKSKRPRSPSPPVGATDDSDGLAPHKDKKLKLLASHALSSPFPDHPHPTPAEAAQVHAVLASAHPTIAPARSAPAHANDSAGTCGKVPDVLESLVGTILSQNTTAKNSTAAKRGLDQTFGRNHFAAIARAPKQDVVDAIRTGGLANKKAGVIQKILQEVKARHGVYSLQHLAEGVGPDSRGKAKAETEMRGDSVVSDEDAMRELVSYDGVGPKTASCVLLFCLGRASFPVDTHVFRLSKLLGWVPSKADRITAQAHLDLTIPAELKYGLHVLMVGHGRRCLGCKGGSRGKGDCVLKNWLREHRGMKDEELEHLAVKAEEDVKAEQS
ncbi:DNA glycosylase [Daedalea quercina L-15889]|uniref:DNA glycosylase n=1 Tax=Daedalea quercina L-15889 TaxID=1314783 RepID=A0A165Q8A5_9APHY|nr:DNA glycosylase [Daedalea quercina L-15889]